MTTTCFLLRDKIMFSRLQCYLEFETCTVTLHAIYSSSLDKQVSASHSVWEGPRHRGGYLMLAGHSCDWNAPLERDVRSRPVRYQVRG